MHAGSPKPMLHLIYAPHNMVHGYTLPLDAACSSAVTRASMSSISIALAAWLKIESAARTRTEAGVAGSTRIFKRAVAAAAVACWSRSVDWPKASRRASRYAF